MTENSFCNNHSTDNSSAGDTHNHNPARDVREYIPDNSYAVPCIYPPQRLLRAKEGDPLTVQVPGSKSITNRALLLATLAEGRSTLRGVLFSDDSRHFLKCIQDLGFETTVNEEAKLITVTGHGGIVPRREANQYVGSAGTAARFLTAYLGVSNGVYHMDASPQMRRRPMAPLLDSLKELGCQVVYAPPENHDNIKTELTAGQAGSPLEEAHGISREPAEGFFRESTEGFFRESTEGFFRESAEGFFPFTLKSHGFGQDHITVNIDHSSQFLSALLIASCLSEKDFTIKVNGTHGMAYIEMTRKMMEQFGVHVETPSPDIFVTKSGQRFQALDYRVEPDVSAACYFYAMVPLLGIPVLVEHVHFASLQGDVAFIRILEQMGCTSEDTPQGILLTPPSGKSFPGVTVDMSACSDQAITLAAIAPFADSPTTITGIGHIRFQESDRIRAICTELTRMGIHCEEGEDSIVIYPGTPEPCLVNTYEDHRMAMGFSLTGLRSEGILIHDPGCCRKTFENYFEVLEEAVARLCQ